MSYTLHIQTGTVTRDFDGFEVAPCQSADDPEFVAYIQWVEAGNEPRVVNYPTPPIPEEVTMRQAQQALLHAGMLDTVEEVVAQADRSVQIDWQKGHVVRRDWSALATVQALLNMTDRQMDELFILADSL